MQWPPSAADAETFCMAANAAYTQQLDDTDPQIHSTTGGAYKRDNS